MDLLEGRFAAQQIPGGRKYQEDDYGLIEPGDPDADRSEVLLIADGMGGHVSGDTASRTVVKTFVEIYHDTDGPIPDRLRVCLNVANDALAEAVKENPELEGMGSTVVAAVVSQHGLDWISVGDSPLWLFRDGKLRRLNADHSMAPVLANLVAVGRMTEEEAATDPKRHALRSAVMGDEIHLIDVSSQPVAIRKSDRLLLASDGLMTLEDEEIAGILQNMQDAPLSEVAEMLIQSVEEVGKAQSGQYDRVALCSGDELWGRNASCRYYRGEVQTARGDSAGRTKEGPVLDIVMWGLDRICSARVLAYVAHA